MPEFLELLPPDEALRLLIKHLPGVKLVAETVPTSMALGRVTAFPIYSPEPLPAFSRSTVDGYAVHVRDTFGASDSIPVYLLMGPDTPMGARPDFSLPTGYASLIHTGGMLPEGADGVVMLEHTQLARPGELEILRAIGVGENILEVGEDVKIGEEVLPVGHILRPAEIGGLMALGITEVNTVRCPRIAILSSGDEVVPPHTKPKPGQVRDVNTFSLSALIQKNGAIPIPFGIIPDRREIFTEILTRAIGECEAVVITAGSSASTRDLTAEVIDNMGNPGVLVHGVNVRPGKPTILAVSNGKAVIGLPGNPVSALVIAQLFVVPVIKHLLGISPGIFEFNLYAKLMINLPSQTGREDWIPCRLVRSGDGFLAEPIFFKSNLIFTLARADGMIYIPPPVTGYAAGDQVKVMIL